VSDASATGLAFPVTTRTHVMPDRRDDEVIRHADGRVVIEGGEYKGKSGDGQFLKRGTCVSF
jgi:hypothetical protein